MKMRNPTKPAPGPSRRDFLELSGQLLLSGAALAISPLSLGTDSIEALKFESLDPAAVRLLTQACRLLFPHDSLEQSVYLDAVKDLDTRIRGDEEKAALIGQAVDFLQAQNDGAWDAAGAERQLAALRAGQQQPWFGYLREATIESLYRNPVVWRLVGYEGSSIEYGGYLKRGFDDIDWLDS
jgi:hypothetical protein